MNLFLTAPGDEPFLCDELKRTFVGAEAELLAPGLLRTEGALQTTAPLTLAFARQSLPNAEALSAASIREWSERLFSVATTQLPEGQPWRLHIAPHYGADGAGGSCSSSSR